MADIEDFLATIPDDLEPFAKTEVAVYYNHKGRVVKKVPLHGCPADIVDKILTETRLLKGCNHDGLPLILGYTYDYISDCLKIAYPGSFSTIIMSIGSHKSQLERFMKDKFFERIDVVQKIALTVSYIQDTAKLFGLPLFPSSIRFDRRRPMLFDLELRALFEVYPSRRPEAYRLFYEAPTPLTRDLLGLSCLVYMACTGQVPKTLEIATFRPHIQPTFYTFNAPMPVQDRLEALVGKCWSFNEELLVTQLRTELIDIALEAVIADPDGLAFWKKFYPHAFVVNFKADKFMPNFIVHFEISAGAQTAQFDVASKAFKYLLSGGENDDSALFEEFSRVLYWFGPLRGKDGMAAVEMLLALEAQLSKTAFHGPIDAHSAEALLASQRIGTYLIRFSGSVPGCYAISCRGRQSIFHIRVYHHPGGPYMYTKPGEALATEYATLTDVIVQVKAANPTNLKHPLHGSKFEELFNRLQDLASAVNAGYCRVSAYPGDEE